MLSSKSVDALVGCAMPTYTMGDKARRAAAREAVRAAAAEIGIDDPLKPPLPRFAAGEDELAAAVLRVVKVPGVEKELAQHRARLAAAEAAAGRVATLERRCAELERAERDRADKLVLAGKEPGAAPADAVKERAAIVAELGLVGGSARFSALMQYESEGSIIRAAAERPDVLPSVVFYCDLVGERLMVLTEDEHYQSATRLTAMRAAHTPQSLASHVNNGTDRELDATVRRVRRAVELADLHRRQERQQQHATIEQLEAVRAGR